MPRSLWLGSQDGRAERDEKAGNQRGMARKFLRDWHIWGRHFLVQQPSSSLAAVSRETWRPPGAERGWRESRIAYAEDCAELPRDVLPTRQCGRTGAGAPGPGPSPRWARQ